jgi:hypothetical protein
VSWDSGLGGYKLEVRAETMAILTGYANWSLELALLELTLQAVSVSLSLGPKEITGTTIFSI